MTVGQWVEICQPGGHWLPFLITAAHDSDTVSGVAFCGQPATVGWHRPSQDFAGVKRGELNHQWREVPPVASADVMTGRISHRGRRAKPDES